MKQKIMTKFRNKRRAVTTPEVVEKKKRKAPASEFEGLTCEFSKEMPSIFGDCRGKVISYIFQSYSLTLHLP